LFFSIKKPFLVIIMSGSLVVLALLLLITTEKATDVQDATDSFYVKIEFQGGLLKENVDEALVAYAAALLETPGITHVESGAKTGQGSVYISFDNRKLDAEAVRKLARETPAGGGFVWTDESSAAERNWRVKISGDDDNICRGIAREAAAACAAIPAVRETALHFKEGSPRMTLRPMRERLAAMGTGAVPLSWSGIADTVRRAVHAPVAYKRLTVEGGLTLQGETDLRVQAGLVPQPSSKDVRELALSGDIPLEALVFMEESAGLSSLVRENRRRTASISVSTASMSARKAAALVMAGLKDIRLPRGYTLDFDREALEAENALRGSFFYLFFALFFCYVVIAASNESFFLPLIVLAASPPALAVPALYIALSGRAMDSAAACAFIAVLGVTVNAAVLGVDALRPSRTDDVDRGCAFGRQRDFDRRRVYRALRGRLGALLATSATSAAGALPFLFLRGNALVKTLSLVSALGVAASALLSITLIPALMGLYTRRSHGCR
jgi:multidrug efflux pump subunit AcrB